MGVICETDACSLNKRVINVCARDEMGVHQSGLCWGTCDHGFECIIAFFGRAFTEGDKPVFLINQLHC